MRPGTRVPSLKQQALNVINRVVVEHSGGCWISNRTPSQKRPYVELPGGKHVIATRVVAAYFYDRNVEPDEDVHHLCEKIRCVNPAHLIIESHFDHLAHHAEKQRQTHCSVHKSWYDGVDARGWGICNACRREAVAAYRKRNKKIIL